MTAGAKPGKEMGRKRLTPLGKYSMMLLSKSARELVGQAERKIDLRPYLIWVMPTEGNAWQMIVLRLRGCPEALFAYMESTVSYVNKNVPQGGALLDLHFL